MGTEDGTPILPRELVDPTGLNATALREFHHARRAWFASHGIDGRDFTAYCRILRASEKAHGLPDRSALARHRLRLTGETK